MLFALSLALAQDTQAVEPAPPAEVGHPSPAPPGVVAWTIPLHGPEAPPPGDPEADRRRQLRRLLVTGGVASASALVAAPAVAFALSAVLFREQ